MWLMKTQLNSVDIEYFRHRRKPHWKHWSMLLGNKYSIVASQFGFGSKL